MAATRPPVRRRRARRGSLERPLNARLYRGTSLVLLLPLLVLAFSFVRPTTLPQPALPPNFDGVDAAQLAHELAQRFPDRSPGGTGSLTAAAWFRDQMRQYNLTVSSDTWRQDVPGLGRQTLQNLWAVAPGESRRAIVVMAHRDDTGAGPGLNDDASGTAALVELARGYARGSAGASSGVRTAHTIVFLSSDGGAYGGLGAARFAAHAPFPVVATIDLTAIGGKGAASPSRRDARHGGRARSRSSSTSASRSRSTSRGRSSHAASRPSRSRPRARGRRTRSPTARSRPRS
jgi:hypothetical protein